MFFCRVYKYISVCIQKKYIYIYRYLQFLFFNKFFCFFFYMFYFVLIWFFIWFLIWLLLWFLLYPQRDYGQNLLAVAEAGQISAYLATRPPSHKQRPVIKRGFNIVFARFYIYIYILFFLLCEYWYIDIYICTENCVRGLSDIGILFSR